MEPMEQDAGYQVTLPEFEGPLDLLLHLVKRHELNILEIPIAFITERYLAYLDMMRSLNLDVAGEYLLMAATLAHIKSIELLPRSAEDSGAQDLAEEGEDPRQELIRRLLEYQKYKEVARQLASRPLLNRQIFGRGARPEGEDPAELQLVEVGTFALIDALADLLRRQRLTRMHDVLVDRISITDRINEIVDRLAQQESLRFVECFSSQGRPDLMRHELVVTFLAILEMARLQMVHILQHTLDGEIYITRTTGLHPVEAVPEDYS